MINAQKKLSVWWIRAVAGLLGLSFPASALLLRSTLESHLASSQPEQLATGLIFLLAVIGLLLAWVILQRPWCKWDESTGTWLNRFTGIRYCEKCKAGKNVITPLKNEITGWRCMSCERWYADPARKEPKPKPLRVSKYRIYP